MTITRRFGHPWICSSSSSADHLPPTIEKMSTSAGLLLSRATPLRVSPSLVRQSESHPPENGFQVHLPLFL